ncbi:MAG: YggS family pyridoxal phosphate-dependent enzyme [Ignavibacteriae bacterium]|nr:YggS family pyridoxal phosphate-dependent enzyme [Ignavibacteriota bacterium]NOG99411.1 YggS family pyridoxal phosphate-dependent enzyme [Ignavibacteriota bacterium]
MVQANLDILEERIYSKCKSSGRDRSEITLVAVSKTHPISLIEEAVNCGVIDFGENKAQEFKSKTEEFKQDVNWHFIGHLQTNKVKYVIDSAHLIHSVDSLKIAKEIEKRASKIHKIQKVLIELNTSGEHSKMGIRDYAEAKELAVYCRNSDSLNLTGLMTMAPYTEEEEILRNCFSELRKIKNKMNDEGFALTELSMGMTNDFEIAIEEGATILRVGSAIFGERNYSKQN